MNIYYTLKKTLTYGFIILMVVSCNLLNKQKEKNAIARVGDNYLYEDDIKTVFSENLSPQDSINLVRNYINNWATKQLLIDKAIINLNEEKLNALETLIQDYRADLYINAYQEALISRVMDTVVQNYEIETFYDDNKENFRLNEELVKLRYIHLNKENSNIKTITESFKRFDPEDRFLLDSLSLQYKQYSLNDSIWIKITQVAEKIPIISLENKDKYLKKSQFFEIEDSLGVYLMHVNDVAKTYDIAPLTYVRPTVRQIILNKRKLEFVNTLEKDIIDEALQKKQFEIYE